MFNVAISNQGNGNQNHNKITPHTCQNGYYEKDNKEQAVQKMYRKRNPRVLSVGLKIYESTMENSMEFSKKLEIELPYDPATSLLGIYPKKTKTLI